MYNWTPKIGQNIFLWICWSKRSCTNFKISVFPPRNMHLLGDYFLFSWEQSFWEQCIFIAVAVQKTVFMAWIWLYIWYLWTIPNMTMSLQQHIPKSMSGLIIVVSCVSTCFLLSPTVLSGLSNRHWSMESCSIRNWEVAIY